MAEAEECYPDLPNPVVSLDRVETFTTDGGGERLRYWIAIENWSEYPDELFHPAPDLYPCGANTNSSRTWVEIVDAEYDHIYGFCGYTDNEDLAEVWFSAAPASVVSRDVRVVLVDRRCGSYYESRHPYLGEEDAYQVFVPGAVHWDGANGSQWRTDVSIANLSGEDGDVWLSYQTTGGVAVDRPGPILLADGASVEVADVASTFPGFADEGSAGTLIVHSRLPVSVTGRTYNLDGAGTFGQFMPGIEREEGLRAGQIGLLQHLKSNGRFRCNVGVVNLGDTACQLELTAIGMSGDQIGMTRSLTVEPGSWRQDDRFFDVIGAGGADGAYVTVRVLTEGCRAWAYGSVIDNETDDPVTVPLKIDRRSSPW